MRTCTLFFSALLLGTTALKAQTVATFDTMHLAHADTFYVNYSAPGTDVGFDNGLAHFPCVYDFSFGSPYWSYGFAYSNMTDSTTPGFGNQYSARAGSGYGGSANYAVAYCFDPVTFGSSTKVILNGAAAGKAVSGCYVTNSTYAYYSMKNGDAFARKFHNGDWFKLTVRGYLHDTLQPASVGVYLADFLFPDTTMNYIVKDWKWVNLAPLGHVDSLDFELSSSDNGAYGMNTPAYFCIDNFTTNEMTLAVNNTQPASIAKVYPNPATHTLFVEADRSVEEIDVLDMTGHQMGSYHADTMPVAISTSALPPGTYILQLRGEGKTATVRFVKE